MLSFARSSLLSLTTFCRPAYSSLIARAKAQVWNRDSTNVRGYHGWVDAKSGDPVDVEAKYEANVLSHSGIRLTGRLTRTLSSSAPSHRDTPEPELFKGYDPKRKASIKKLTLHRISSRWKFVKKLELEHQTRRLDSAVR